MSTTLAQASTDPLKHVAAELSDEISAHGKTKVAVFALPHYDGHISDGPYMVSERLANFLSTDKKIVLVERNQLLQVLQELHLSETGALDSATTKKIGEMLGAEVIVTGTLIDIAGNQTEVNARGILADNGRIIAASRATLNRDWEARQRLEW